MEDHPTSPAANGPVAKPARIPWNKGKLVGAKPHCDQATSGLSGRSYR